jgi:cbb3-type cytochrome oxidase maturation protein
LLELTIAQFVVATLMSLSALFFFIWAVLSGMFKNVEAIAMRAYRSEVADDDTQRRQASPPAG